MSQLTFDSEPSAKSYFYVHYTIIERPVAVSTLSKPWNTLTFINSILLPVES